MDVFRNSDEFWTYSTFLGLLFVLCGLIALRKLYFPSSYLFLPASLTYLAAHPVVYTRSIGFLSDETFALPFVVVYFAVAWKMFRAGGGGVGPEQGDGVRNLDERWMWRISRRDLLCLGLGTLTAIGWSIKTYYLAPAIGVMVAAVIALRIGAVPIRIAARSAGMMLGGFIVTVAILVRIFMGNRFFGHWVLWNWEILIHTDRYGEGAVGFANVHRVFGNIVDITRSSWGMFPLVVLLVTLGGGVVAWRMWRDEDWRKDRGPVAIALLVSVGLELIAGLKHYAPHYLIICVASMPVIAYLICMDPAGRKWFARFGWVSGVTFMVTLAAVIRVHDGTQKYAKVVQADVNRIESLAVAPNERRFWAYFVPSRAQVAQFVGGYSNSDLVVEEVREFLGPADVTASVDRTSADWEYIVFPKSYYPTKESIGTNYLTMFDMKLTDFRPRSSDVVKEFKTVFLVTRGGSG